MSNSIFSNNFIFHKENNKSDQGIFSSNFQNVFNDNKNQTSFNNGNLFFQKNNQLMYENQINSQNNNNSFILNLKQNDLKTNIFGNNISSNFSIFNNNNKNDNNNLIFKSNNFLNNQNSIFSSKNENENTINMIYKNKEIYEMINNKKEKSLLISFTVDNFSKGSFEEYRLADIEYQKTKKNELYKIIDKSMNGITVNNSNINSNSIFDNNILNNNNSIFNDNNNMIKFGNNEQILNQSNNIFNKNNTFINPPQLKNNIMLNSQNNLNNNNTLKTFGSINTINSQNNNNNLNSFLSNNNNSNINSFLPNNKNNNLNTNNNNTNVFFSNENNNTSSNNNSLNNLQNIFNNNNPLFNQDSFNYISKQEINKNNLLNNQNYSNNSFDIPFQIFLFQDNENLKISDSVENAILKKKDINCFIQEMHEKYSNKDKDNFYFGKFLKNKSLNINTSYIKKPKKNIEYYHKKYSNLYDNTTKKRYLNYKKDLLLRSNSINSSFSKLLKNENEKKILTSIKKSKNEDYNFTNNKKIDKNYNKENNDNNYLKKQLENKKRNIISYKVQINLPNNEKFILNFDEINTINKVKVLKNQIQEKLENILTNNFPNEIIDKISILIQGTLLSDDKLLNSYIVTENIEAIIIYKKMENTTLIKKKKIAPIELIPKLSKNGYHTFPEYIYLCRMSEYELSNIENFKIYNEYGEIQFLEKINLLGANLDNDYIIEKNQIEIKRNLNVKIKCILYHLKFENYDENIMKQFKEKIKEKNGEFISYEPLNGRLEWNYVN